MVDRYYLINLNAPHRYQVPYRIGVSPANLSSPVSIGKYHYQRYCPGHRIPRSHFDRICIAPCRTKRIRFFRIKAQPIMAYPVRDSVPLVLCKASYSVVNVQAPAKAGLQVILFQALSALKTHKSTWYC